jgi:hypothetical protein
MKTAGSRGIPTRALYIGIGLCALLAIVALATRGGRPSSSESSSDRALPGDVFDYMFTFSILLAVAMVLLFGWLRAQTGPEARKTWSGRQMFLFLITVAAVCVAAVLISESLRENPDSRLARLLNRDTAPAATTDAQGRRVRPREPQFEWPAVLIAGALVAVGFGVYRVGRRRDAPEERTLREDIAAILDDTLEKLQAEEDPRRAVILAYAWMERTLAAHGLPRVPSEAPLEYLARVLIELEASRDSVFELTALFERAKFSAHDVDEEMKHEAIVALTAVRDDLRETDEQE